MNKEKVSIFWFRRDLRLNDNHGLYKALEAPFPVLPIFIFDTDIIGELETDDPRVTFIHDQINELNQLLKASSGGIYCLQGPPLEVWNQILNEFEVHSVYANEDYEPYAIIRDQNVGQLLSTKGITFNLFKDQVIFAKNDIVKEDGAPYTVFTPYKNKWWKSFGLSPLPDYSNPNFQQLYPNNFPFPSLADIGFKRSSIKVLKYNLEHLAQYQQIRDYPGIDQTTKLSPHLRFGTVSIREIVRKSVNYSTFVNELIWREFFMQILYHFPQVVGANFKRKYDQIPWRNVPEEFELWKQGNTGYPLVDAGMRELNKTGYMHNRVRMVVASFLCKHLLIDWRWGEAYFAKKLLDYELSSNNGNWQWAAGTGCDAAPYFRVFNPSSQAGKFDPQQDYIKKWVPDHDTQSYPLPMVEHAFARSRAINTYKKAMS